MAAGDDIPRTGLSVGEIIRDVLANDGAVLSRTTKIYPVAVDSAELPYVVYRRMQFEQTAPKTPNGQKGADTVDVEVMCYAKDYSECVELAELVRAALDGKQHALDGLVMRSCTLADGEEAWQGDAFAQQLVFRIRI